MKKIILIIITFSCFEISYGQDIAKLNNDFKKLSWLEGRWIRTNVKPGQTAYEEWTRISASEWKGVGLRLQGTDTAFVEKLKMVVKNDGIYYVADVTGNRGSVGFKLTEITEDGFTCENPQHDFPKKISYQKSGTKVKATISGNGKSFDYLFEKG